MRGVAVRGEEEHTFGEIVEPSDVREPRCVRYDVEHRAPSLRVGASRHDARRLVEDEPSGVGARGHGADPFPGDGDTIVRWMHGLANLRDVIVHGDAPGGNQLFCVSPRRDAGARKRTLDAHRLDHEAPYSGMDAGTGARSAIANSSARGSSSR